MSLQNLNPVQTFLRVDPTATTNNRSTPIELAVSGNHKEVLKILVKAVAENVEDCSGQGSSKLRPQLQKLLGRITVGSPREPAPWHLYGDLLSVVGQEEVPLTPVSVLLLSSSFAGC